MGIENLVEFIMNSTDASNQNEPQQNGSSPLTQSNINRHNAYNATLNHLVGALSQSSTPSIASTATSNANTYYNPINNNPSQQMINHNNPYNASNANNNPYNPPYYTPSIGYNHNNHRFRHSFNPYPSDPAPTINIHSGGQYVHRIDKQINNYYSSSSKIQKQHENGQCTQCRMQFKVTSNKDYLHKKLFNQHATNYHGATKQFVFTHCGKSWLFPAEWEQISDCVYWHYYSRVFVRFYMNHKNNIFLFFFLFFFNSILMLFFFVLFCPCCDRSFLLHISFELGVKIRWFILFISFCFAF